MFIPWFTGERERERERDRDRDTQREGWSNNETRYALCSKQRGWDDWLVSWGARFGTEVAAVTPAAWGGFGSRRHRVCALSTARRRSALYAASLYFPKNSRVASRLVSSSVLSSTSRSASVQGLSSRGGGDVETPKPLVLGCVSVPRPAIRGVAWWTRHTQLVLRMMISVHAFRAHTTLLHVPDFRTPMYPPRPKTKRTECQGTVHTGTRVS